MLIINQFSLIKKSGVFGSPIKYTREYNIAAMPIDVTKNIKEADK
jgi:hypothetical protein